jgi:hypothetical protein
LGCDGKVEKAKDEERKCRQRKLVHGEDIPSGKHLCILEAKVEAAASASAFFVTLS